jgi:hypothetical protein
VVRHDTDRLCRELLRLAHLEGSRARAPQPALR